MTDALNLAMFSAVAEVARIRVEQVLIDAVQNDELADELPNVVLPFLAVTSGASAALANIIRALDAGGYMDGADGFKVMQKAFADHWDEARQGDPRLRIMVQ